MRKEKENFKSQNVHARSYSALAPEVTETQRGGHFIGQSAPKQNSELRIPSKGRVSVPLLCSAVDDCLSSRTLGSPPRVCASEPRCQKEILNRHQTPLCYVLESIT